MWKKRCKAGTPRPGHRGDDGVVQFATRIEGRLKQAIVRADVERMSIAAVSRLAGVEAERLGVTRPSYDAVRRLVLVERARRQDRRDALRTAADEVFAYTGVDYLKLTGAMLATRRAAVHGSDD